MASLLFSTVASSEGESPRCWPYGSTRTGEVGTAYRYTGQRLDGSSELYYYGARWYDPALGRFIQPDTIVPEPGNPQDLNRFSYARNNPIKYTDPTGHYVLLDDATEAFRRFAVRSTTDGGWRVVIGGYHFRNAYEMAYANYFLSAGSTPLPPNPGGAYGSSLIGSVTNAFSEVNGIRSSEVPAFVDAALVAGGSMAATKLVEIGVGEAFAFAGAGIASLRASSRMSVPNPGGRLGGPEHRAAVDAVVAGMKDRQLRTRTEFRIDTPGGFKPYRYVDAAGFDEEGNLVELHQVGALTVSGSPVAREMRALSDIHSAYPNIPLFFHEK